jgi:energy-converting hydrogenase Eha subunit C
MYSIVLLAAASLLGAGILFRHHRFLTLLAAAGVLFEGQWLALTLVHRLWFSAVAEDRFFLIGSLLVLIGWAIFYKKWSFPYRVAGSGRRDAVILVLLAITLLAAWSIARLNGFEGGRWVMHGFYNGDTATFSALTERSLTTSELVRDNPFAGNGPLEYPTLLHAGVATFLRLLGVGSEWQYFLPLFTYIQILFTLPLFFLLWDMVYPEPAEGWKQWLGVPRRWSILLLQAGIVAYVLFIAWDTYVYPQSHFFLTGAFLLLSALLVHAYRQRAFESWLVLTTAFWLGVVLLLANAVTGTAALALLVGFALLRVIDRKQPPLERGLFVLVSGILMALFFVATPGQASFGTPGFSYTAAVDTMRLAPIIIVLLGAAGMQLSRLPFMSIASVLLVGLGFFTFFFSTRDIVIENASRFFYHALLIGFPLLLSPMVQLWYWARRELLYTSHTLGELFAGWSAVAALGLIFLLPAGASVASAHDHLWRKDEQVVGVLQRDALWWIEETTTPQTIFLASPNEPFMIPFFTGRAVLRTNYWLSPDDRIQEQVNQAFAGDVAAREAVLAHVDYLFLSKAERTSWEPSPLTKAFDNGEVVIYQVK